MVLEKNSYMLIFQKWFEKCALSVFLFVKTNREKDGDNSFDCSVEG